ncbi:hypothetical protein Bca52824_015958 [Brassica carinata]|uniref:Uncharacterized protein n=1 Tax=Brassica carinata TaxID=52824 RepID=A0A8X7W5J0_BRACI|nr:hypothetical protein Bca52824_015958 [Brassica carinata]
MNNQPQKQNGKAHVQEQQQKQHGKLSAIFYPPKQETSRLGGGSTGYHSLKSNMFSGESSNTGLLEEIVKERMKVKKNI